MNNKIIINLPLGFWGGNLNTLNVELQCIVFEHRGILFFNLNTLNVELQYQ